jgi:uncharacterized membrane protein YeiH
MTRDGSLRREGRVDADTLLFTVDIAGTILFGIEGATAALGGHLDAFGVLVLAFVTALGGGIIRDLLIGAAPPASLRDWRYPAAAFFGGALVLLLRQFVTGASPSMLTMLDAAGLALFAVAGTRKALDYEIHPSIAILMGVVTAVGGGCVRDIFLAQIPAVLRVEIYATAALVGSACMVAALKLRIAPALAAAAGGGVCFLLRMVSVWQHWNLPA